MNTEVLATWEKEEDGKFIYTLTAEQTDTLGTLVVVLPERPRDTFITQP